MIWLLTLFIVLDTMHVMSPLVLSWMHPGLRKLMLIKPRKYIVPALVVFLGGAMAAIWSAIAGRGLCWVTMIKIYALWNFYHFSMQNYGVLRLCGLRNEPLGRVLAFAGTAAGIMTIPAAISVHHWITDIGLSARVIGSKSWLFVVALLCAAPIAFLWDRAPWLWPQLDAVAYHQMTPIVIFWVGLRHSLGMSHFKVSGLIWKLSDPQVRATIGRDLFG